MVICLLVGVTAGCGVSEQGEAAARTRIAAEILATQASESQKHTQIAAEIFSTQTAAVPTAIATHPPSPTWTPTPPPDAMVKAVALLLYDGPSSAYEAIGNLATGDVLEVIGQLYDCAWLKVIAPDDSEGWVNGHAANLQFNLECASVPIGSYRPLNGEILEDRRGGLAGVYGELEVDNGSSNDALVVIAKPDTSPLVAFYVRAGRQFTLAGIPDSTYSIYIATGRDWDGTTHQMAVVFTYQRFDEMFLFETSGNSYTVWSITLHAVPGGTGNTEPVDPDDFPDLGGP